MLIYNHNKEFIGIDDENLKLLGYSSFDKLLAEHQDIAELFVKKPGYIHNFKNFPWIDFVLHADAEETKAIIQGRNRSFACQLDIVPFYLNDAPEKEAYLVKLKHIQTVQLSDEERIQAAVAKPLQPPVTEPLPEAAPSFEAVGPAAEEATSFEAVETTPLDEIHLDVFADTEERESAPLYHEQEPVAEAEAPEAELPSHEPEIAEAPAQRPMLGDYINQEEQAFIDNLRTDKDYVYDPHVASDELGLPVDLIEEFIGDFINQAHEFRDELFSSAQEEDFDNVKILSHKLKGVAANLRIEDAFEVLSIINESGDSVEIEANLKQFYIIIAKLEGKGIPQPEPAAPPITEEDDIYTLEPRFDEPPAPIPETAAAEPPAPEIPETEELYDLGFGQEPEAPSPLVEEETHEIFPKVEASEPPAEAAAPSETAEPLNVAPLRPIRYDANDVALELGLGSDLVHALVKDYVDEADGMQQMFNDALSASEASRWQELAIRLKGVSDNLRMNEISAALQKLISTEEKSEAGNAVDEFYGYIHQLS